MERNRHYTLWLAGIMVGIFILQNLFPAITNNFILDRSTVLSRPWTLLTAIFLHASIAHILFNGFGLVIFGLILEQIIGSKRFLMIFFATGIVSSIASAFVYKTPVLGASGAIFGVMGALTVLRPTMTVWVYYIPMPMYIAAFVWAAVDLFGFFFPSGIANAGHLGGLIAGIVAGFLLRGKQPIVIGGKRKKGDFEVMTTDEFSEWEKQYMREP